MNREQMARLSEEFTDQLEQILEVTFIKSERNAIEREAIELIRKARLNKQKPPELFKDEFEIFWKKYDKKVSRAAAYKAWNKLKEDEVKQILATVDVFVRVHNDPKFRPHAATYINQRRWEDEIKGVSRPKPDFNKIVNDWKY